MASDFGEEGESSVHSAAEHSDSASHEAEYVNPRGVRFMPHQQHKDGKLVKINKLVALIIVSANMVVSCDICNNTYMRHHDMVRHKRKHNPERLNCQYCNYQHYNTSCLRRHIMNKHRNIKKR